MARGTPVVTLRLDPDLRRNITAIAKEGGKTVSDLIREALIEYCWNHSGADK